MRSVVVLIKPRESMLISDVQSILRTCLTCRHIEYNGAYKHSCRRSAPSCDVDNNGSARALCLRRVSLMILHMNVLRVILMHNRSCLYAHTHTRTHTYTHTYVGVRYVNPWPSYMCCRDCCDGHQTSAPSHFSDSAHFVQCKYIHDIQWARPITMFNIASTAYHQLHLSLNTEYQDMSHISPMAVIIRCDNTNYVSNINCVVDNFCIVYIYINVVSKSLYGIIVISGHFKSPAHYIWRIRNLVLHRVPVCSATWLRLASART